MGKQKQSTGRVEIVTSYSQEVWDGIADAYAKVFGWSEDLTGMTKDEFVMHKNSEYQDDIVRKAASHPTPEQREQLKQSGEDAVKIVRDDRGHSVNVRDDRGHSVNTV